MNIISILRPAMLAALILTGHAQQPQLTALTISPKTATVQTGETMQFRTQARWSTNRTTFARISYSTTGGTIASTGRYTAPSTPGTYLVIAAHVGGTLRDTAVVTVQAAVTLTSLTINPKTVTLGTGATQQFSVNGTWSNGATTAPTVTYTATGGTVTAGGLYTAPSTAGTYRVIAAHTGGTLRDTGVVTVTGPVADPLLEPVPTSNVIFSDNFDSYSTITGGANSLEGPWALSPGDRPTFITGRGGSGKAVRFDYTTTKLHYVIERNISARTNIVVQYWFRFSAGADPTSGGDNYSGMKWLILNRATGVGRYTFGISNMNGGGPPGVSNTGREFTVFDESAAPNMPDPFVQNVTKTVKQSTVADGQWHRYTVQVQTGSGGWVRVWVDGTLVLNTQGYAYNHSPDGIAYIDLPANVNKILPGYNFTLDVDDIRAWVPEIPASSGFCPNEPAGLTLVGDTKFPTLNPSGWQQFYGQLVSDASGPELGTSIAFRFPKGSSEGGYGAVEPANGLPAQTRRVYSCFVWKQSPNFQNHPSDTKVLYPFRATRSGERRDFVWGFEPVGSVSSGTFRSKITTQSSVDGDNRRDNLAAMTFRTGRWYRTEILVVHNTPGVKNGTYTAWTSEWNGTAWTSPVRHAHWTDLGYSDSGDAGYWTRWQFDQYMGGQGGSPVPEDQFIYFNRIRVAASR